MSEEEKPKIDYFYKIAKLIADGKSTINLIYCLEEDRFYYYDNGVWRFIFEIELLNIISSQYQWMNNCTVNRRKQVFENLKSLTHKRVDLFNVEGYLNFPQGLLSPLEEKIIPHDMKYISTFQMKYNYDEFATCPLWTKTLLEIFDNDNDKVLILQEFFGYCLTRDTRKEKALLLLGESRTGKSTILHVLRELVGRNNCSSVPLKFISNPQYTPMLINKMVNIDSDVSGKAEAFEAEFKIITSGEPVSVNQKFVATFEFSPYCKLVMAANEFPRITDHSSAFYKRLILLPCDRVFEEAEQDIRLKDKLIKELPGILNWATLGLQRLYMRGRFEQKDFMREAVSQLREESNPVEAFFKDHIKTDVSADFMIDKADLYKNYRNWCTNNGNLPLSSIKFSQAVYRKYSSVTPKDSKVHNPTRRVWRNLIYIGDTQVQTGSQVNWQE